MKSLFIFYSFLLIISQLLDVLLPYKKRPESTGMVARNLVAGALGIRTTVSREQRQKEKQMLSEARGWWFSFDLQSSIDVTVKWIVFPVLKQHP